MGTKSPFSIRVFICESPYCISGTFSLCQGIQNSMMAITTIKQTLSANVRMSKDMKKGRRGRVRNPANPMKDRFTADTNPVTPNHTIMALNGRIGYKNIKNKKK